jgi:uncharacterized iron-regulated membrane protein
MIRLKVVHRITGIIIMIVLIYLSVTGLMMQGIDLGQIMFRHVDPVDPDIVSMVARQGGEFRVLSADDKTAQALPASLDANAAIQNAVKSMRASLGAAPLRYVEVRMFNGKLVGNVQTAQLNATFDGETGALLNMSPVTPLPEVTSIDRLRYRIKEFHRMTIYGNWALWINIVAGLSLFLMIVTGVSLYLRMWSERRKQGLSGLIWVGGEGKKEDWKRAMHRGVGLTIALFLLVVAFSGEWLAYESLVFGYHIQHAMQQRMARMSANGTGQNSPRPDRAVGNRVSEPQLLKDAEIPALLGVTLNSARHAGAEQVKAIRIRAFGNVQQGVVISGDGDNTQQLSFNATTGQPVSGDPQAGQPGFPWGWDAHQLGKAIHRGSYFGTWARFVDFIVGLGLLYLCINGLALYIDFRRLRKEEPAISLAVR